MHNQNNDKNNSVTVKSDCIGINSDSVQQMAMAYDNQVVNFINELKNRDGILSIDDFVSLISHFNIAKSPNKVKH